MFNHPLMHYSQVCLVQWVFTIEVNDDQRCVRCALWPDGIDVVKAKP